MNTTVSRLIRRCASLFVVAAFVLPVHAETLTFVVPDANPAGRSMGGSLTIEDATHGGTKWTLDLSRFSVDGVLMDFGGLAGSLMRNGGKLEFNLNGLNDSTAFQRANLHIVKSSGESQFLAQVTSPVPEPQTVVMMIAGLAGLGLLARRRRRTERT